MLISTATKAKEKLEANFKSLSEDYDKVALLKDQLRVCFVLCSWAPWIYSFTNRTNVINCEGDSPSLIPHSLSKPRAPVESMRKQLPRFVSSPSETCANRKMKVSAARQEADLRMSNAQLEQRIREEGTAKAQLECEIERYGTHS